MSFTSKARNERIASNRFIILLALLLLASIALALLSYSHVERWFAYNARYMEEVTSQQVFAQQLAKYSLMARQGGKTSFAALRKVREESFASISVLKNGVSDDGLPASPEVVAGTLREVEREWKALHDSVDKVLAGGNAINNIHESKTIIIKLLPTLSADNDDLVQILMSRNASEDQIFVASNQLVILQRVENNLRRLLTGGQESSSSAQQFSQDIDDFAKALEKLLNGSSGGEARMERVAHPDGRRKLEKLTKDFKPILEAAAKISDMMSDAKTKTALDAMGDVSQTSDRVDGELKKLYNAYRMIPGRLTFLGMAVSQVTVLLFGGLAAIFLILLGVQILTDARRREVESKLLNETNQKAILRLLDEMGDLADGDLTVQATVTEDITGAIADSINYAIDALRKLVTTINETSGKISAASQDTHNTAMHLAEASEHQAQQISQATTAIKNVTKAIDGMAGNAKESADVASRSVGIANKGAAIVRNTISGMNTNREQIQETSKRIKRLGENAQEIGEIVEIIDDIADQTNILALNAAMQAAMAGEAGRGFAVVADAVQRLAERSSNSAKQIEALVKTIQADTNEAVQSMELSTSGVVRGARLAEDAGKALEEIEDVSNYIANLTKKIADSASNESQAALKVDEGMSVIQDITTQTAEGTRKTAASVGTLAGLARDLQHSVAGFKLPQ